MNDFLEKQVGNEDFYDYFKKLGCEVSWDCSRRSGEEWYEIYKDGDLLLQVDMGVPLKYIISDFIALHTGEPSTMNFVSDYKITGPETKDTKELYKKVYEHEQRIKI